MKLNVYHYMILFLLANAAFVLAAGSVTVPLNFVAHIFIVTLVAVVADLIINKIKGKKFYFPKSAMITGLILSSVLAPAPLVVQIVAPLVAILSKHIIRYNDGHFFNPAGFAAFVTSLAFGIGTAWWAAGTNLAGAVVSLFFIFALTVYKIRKLRLTITYLIVWFVLASAQALLSNRFDPQVIFLDFTILWFAFVMLIEPMTSPDRAKAKYAYAVIAAVLTLVFRTFLTVDFILAALLVANVIGYFLDGKHRKALAEGIGTAMGSGTKADVEERVHW